MGTISDEVVRAAPLLQRPRSYDPVKIVEARAAGITVARARELGARVRTLVRRSSRLAGMPDAFDRAPLR